MIPLVNKQKVYITEEDLIYFKSEEMLKIKQERQLKNQSSEGKANLDDWEIYKLAMRLVFDKKGPKNEKSENLNQIDHK